ncbi:MAG: hypothetical protein WC101_04465 [Candidatus Gracilibacteria bacterium]
MVDTHRHTDELVSIVHSPNWSTPEHPIVEVDEHIMFDVMIDLVRRSGVFAEIGLAPDNSARSIRVLKKDANHARHLLREADKHGILQDMVNDRTEWDI